MWSLVGRSGGFKCYHHHHLLPFFKFIFFLAAKNDLCLSWGCPLPNYKYFVNRMEQQINCFFIGKKVIIGKYFESFFLLHHFFPMHNKKCLYSVGRITIIWFNNIWRWDNMHIVKAVYRECLRRANDTNKKAVTAILCSALMCFKHFKRK